MEETTVIKDEIVDRNKIRQMELRMDCLKMAQQRYNMAYVSDEGKSIEDIANEYLLFITK